MSNIDPKLGKSYDPMLGGEVNADEPVIKGKPEPTPGNQVFLAVWDSLSARCQSDIRNAKTGAVIRCTPSDMALVRSVTILPEDKVAKLEERVAELEERLATMADKCWDLDP